MQNSMFLRKVKNIKYNPETRTLIVLLNDDLVKSYSNVPEKVFSSFSKSPDKTSYYLEKIEGHFPLG
jgi:hypothetical protein